ncbi:hypothetical protein AXE80_07220 [Wenyingzhuangia fucanilytica]|uniref:Uncharacterized protein n=1 Tax=Wenyingzhuangia fucanilytica TaxID=1790137 RepID=A0A1B1Y5P6_9FLAO|nr:hypothetical protein [Wenyingzhuangia fucanilytica]ANW96080.1 hypothetical protein AXE80_07220 [Wenyingzhuangia fucanilytica]
MQKEIVRDTIVKVIEKTIQPISDNSEIYKEIINSQSQTYNLIIVVFLGIIALFAGATWLYNKKIVKAEIIKETDKVFKKEKDKLIKQFKTEFEGELNFVKGESARLFANSIDGTDPGDYSNKYYWWMQCVKYYKAIDKGKGVRISVENALHSLTKAIETKEESKKYIIKTYPELDENFYDIIKIIPNELDKEKSEIKELTEELLK